MFNGLFDRYEHLRVGFLEGGVAWLLVALERFDRSYSTHVPFNPRGELLLLDGAPRLDRCCTHGRRWVGAQQSRDRLDETHSATTRAVRERCLANVRVIMIEQSDDTFIEHTPEGKVANQTTAIATLGGATMDIEENYLIKKLFSGGLGVVSIENQARI